MAGLKEITGWFSKRPSKGAADEMLEKVIAEERDRSVMAVCWLRFLFGTVNALALFPTIEVAGYSTTWPTRYGAVVYAALAALLFLVMKWRPSLRRLGALAPAFFDVPVIGLIELKQATYSSTPGLGTHSSMAMLLGFLLVSSMAFSRTVILVVLPPTLIFLWLILSVSQVPIAVRVNIMVVTCGFAAMGLVLVGKLRALVTAARKRDLLGKYVLGDRLGAGGMAEVFRAVYSPEGGFERVVAVKRILPAYAGNEEIVTLFRREAELGARLAHPNVVQVLDFGSDGDSYFLAMEFLDGVSLGRVLQHHRKLNRTLPVPLLLLLTRELCAALEYLHTRTGTDGAPMNLVHRDFNPPNILLSRVGEVKLADFGIARAADRPALTQPGIMRGKLAYASPEQVTDQPLDGRADLFALGITLFEASTMRRLFGQKSETEVLRDLLEGAPVSVSRHRADLPPAFCREVERLLERELRSRTAHAADVLVSLGPLMSEHAAKGREQLIALVAEVAAAPEVPSQDPLAPQLPGDGVTATVTAPTRPGR